MLEILKLSLLNLSRRKRRTLLALLGIVVGIGALVLLVSIVDGLYVDATSTFGKIQGISVYSESAPYPPLSKLDISYQNKLESINGVKKAVPEIVHIVGIIDDKKQEFSGPNSYKLVGLNSDDIANSSYNSIDTKLISGSFVKESDSKQVIISKDIADDFKKHVGSKIKIDKDTYTVKGIFASSSSLTNGAMITNIKDVQTSYQIDPKIISDFSVILLNPDDSTKVSKAIEFKYDQLKAQSREERMEQISDLISNLKLLVILVSIVAAVIAGLGVINTMLMSVLERTKEIGTLKAVGWTENDILKMIIMESLIIGVVGAILGILFGSIFALLLSNFITTYISPSTIILSFLFGAMLGLFGGLYPAYSAAKQDPVTALRGS